MSIDNDNVSHNAHTIKLLGWANDAKSADAQECLTRQNIVRISDRPRSLQAFRGKRLGPAGNRANSPPPGKEMGSDEEIVSCDQISDLAERILPVGAIFRIEDLNLHGHISVFERTGSSFLPVTFDEIWKKEFSTFVFEDPGMEEEVIQWKAIFKTKPRRFRLFSLLSGVCCNHGSTVVNCPENRHESE